MGENRLRRAAYSGFDKGWIEKKERIIREKHPSGSTCVSTDDLRRIGRDLQKDLEAHKQEYVPGKFADIGEIEY